MELITKMLFRVHFIEYGYSHFVRLSTSRSTSCMSPHKLSTAVSLALRKLLEEEGGGALGGSCCEVQRDGCGPTADCHL